MIQDLVKKNRSYRRFDENYDIDIGILIKLVNLARHCGSAANLQPLRYLISNNRETNGKIFQCTKWAGYLSDWDGPQEGERPAGYIIILGDVDYPKHHQIDTGIAAQTIMLAAAEIGLGGCMLAALNREKLREVLEISKQYEIILAIALGKPRERVLIGDVSKSGSIKYYRDKKDNHIVPKRSLDDIIYKIKTG